MFDSHSHSKNSPDSKQTLDEICCSAIEKGIRGIAVTDHVDMWFYIRDNTYECIQNSIAEIRAAQEKYRNKLQVFCGIELGEYLYDRENADKILGLTDFDIILGSVHSIILDDWTDSYSRLCFDERVPQEKIMRFLKKYFAKLEEMIVWGGFDVLSHLTCPLRYINGKYHRNIDIMQFKNEITLILEHIIQKGIALEVNTSGIHTFYGELMPPMEILEIYKALGGELITLGGDAHVPENIANGFPEILEMLTEAGFGAYYYYQHRQPKRVPMQ